MFWQKFIQAQKNNECCEKKLTFSKIPKWFFTIDIKVSPNTNKTNPKTINTINIIVSTIAFILKYITALLFLSFILYTECNPLVKANKALPADHIVNIIDNEIVPIDFEYTSFTTLKTKSFMF